MKFLIDADSPHSLKEIFSKHGHDAVHAADELGSVTDDEIFEYANKNHCIIVTRDKGFAQTLMENKGLGLILIRLPYYFTVDKINKVFDALLKEIDAKELIGAITVVELGRYRIKKL